MTFTTEMLNTITSIKDDTEFAKQAFDALAAYVEEKKPHHDEVIAEHNKRYEEFHKERVKEEEDKFANASPTTHETLVKVWNEAVPVLREIGAIVAGGFVSSYIKWDDRKVPGDMDVWTVKNAPGYPNIGTIPGWEYYRSYSPTGGMPASVKSITEFRNTKYQLKIQVIKTNVTDPYKVVKNFDFDVCKGVMSPGLDDNGKVIGIRATSPQIYKAIMENKATFLERPWDCRVEEGRILPNQKALNRYDKYKAKGYDIVMHEKSSFTLDMFVHEEPVEKKAIPSSYEPAPQEKDFGYYYGYVMAMRNLSGDYDSPENQALDKLIDKYSTRLRDVELERKYWTAEHVFQDTQRKMKLDFEKKTAVFLNRIAMDEEP